MTRIERQPKRTPSQERPGDVTSLSPANRDALNTYRQQLEQENREWSKRFHAQADKSMREYFDMRDREPKVSLTLKEWHDYRDMRRQQEAEARARGEDPDAIKPAPLVAEKHSFDTTVPLTPEQQRERNTFIVREQRTRLASEVQKAELDLIAADIQQEMWHDTGRWHKLSVIKPAADVRITVKDDGIVIDRSRIGFSLAYPVDGKRKKEGEDTQQDDLSMGIGYFADRSQIVPEAQGAISDEDLVRGVKAYYVQRTYVEKATNKQKTETIVIPFAYADAQQTFFKHLYDSSKMLAPERMLPPQEAQRYRRLSLAA